MKKFKKFFNMFLIAAVLLCSLPFTASAETQSIDPVSAYICDFDNNYISSGLIADKNTPNTRATRGEILHVNGEKMLNFYADNNKEDFRFEIFNKDAGICSIKHGQVYVVSITYKITHVARAVNDKKMSLELIRYDGESTGNVIKKFNEASLSGGESMDSFETASVYFTASLEDMPQNNILAIRLTSPNSPDTATESENLITSVLFDEIVVKEFESDAKVITFETNGSEYIDPTVTTAGSDIMLPTPERELHTFGGWYTNLGLSQAFKDKKMPNRNLTLYAKWTPTDEATVISFDSNGGNAISSISGKAGDKLILPRPTRSGFRFVGWYTPDGKRLDQTTVFPVKSVKLKARYEHDVIVANFSNKADYDALTSNAFSGRFDVVNETSYLSNNSVKYDTAAGWNPSNYYAAAGGILLDSKGNYVRVESGVTYKISFYCKFDSAPEEYMKGADKYIGYIQFLTANQNGSWGNRVTYTRRTYTAEDLTGEWVKITQEITPECLDTANYLYLGISGYSVLYIDDLRIWRVDSNIKEREEYSLSFDTDGGNWIDTVYGEPTQVITLPEDPVKEGYNFMGWYSDITLEKPFKDTKFVDDNIILYAAWQEIPKEVPKPVVPETEENEEQEKPSTETNNPQSEETEKETKGNKIIIIIVAASVVVVVAVVVVLIMIIKKKKEKNKPIENKEEL